MLLIIILAIAGTLLLVPAFFVVLFLGWAPTTSAIDDDAGLRASSEQVNGTR